MGVELREPGAPVNNNDVLFTRKSLQKYCFFLEYTNFSCFFQIIFVILQPILQIMVVTDPKIDNPILHLVGEEADRLGLECYVIGGWVRDLFLHRPSDDIDIVVVGSQPSATDRQPSGIGIMLAEAVAQRLGKGAHLSVFKTYGTAQVKRGELELEFVGARRESYTRDSRNPIVEDGTLQEDQDRRDFTINAMAICLNQHRSVASSVLP